MKLMLVAALALIIPVATSAQAPVQAPSVSGPDLSYAATVGGNWTYAPLATGSEATYVDGQLRPQVTIRCTRLTRRVSIAKPVSAAVSALWVWTSSQTRSLPATFDATSSRVSADLPAFDPLLDAIAWSRGRIGFSTAGAAPLVVPPWSEVGRVIEDCRV